LILTKKSPLLNHFCNKKTHEENHTRGGVPLRANKSQSVIIISYNFAVSILNKEQTAVRRILLFGNNDDK